MMMKHRYFSRESEYALIARFEPDNILSNFLSSA
jgi:hypothetical protein